MRKNYQERIKELREDAEPKITQKEIAQILGISYIMYQRYEYGKSEMPARHLITLAKYYRTSADYILGLFSEIASNLLGASSYLHDTQSLSHITQFYNGARLHGFNLILYLRRMCDILNTAIQVTNIAMGAEITLTDLKINNIPPIIRSSQTKELKKLIQLPTNVQ